MSEPEDVEKYLEKAIQYYQAEFLKENPDFLPYLYKKNMDKEKPNSGKSKINVKAFEDSVDQDL